MDERKLDTCHNCHELMDDFRTTNLVLQKIYSLPSREYKILILWIIEKKKIEDIAKAFSVTRNRIQEIKIKMQRRLQPYSLQIIEKELLNNIDSLKFVTTKNIYVFNEEEFKDTHQTLQKNIITLEKKLSITDSIMELDLDVRSHNCLKGSGINTIEELLEKTDEELLSIKNYGRKALRMTKFSIQEFMAKLEDQNNSSKD